MKLYKYMKQSISSTFIRILFFYILIFFAVPNLQAARDYTPPPVEQKTFKQSKRQKINRKKLRLNFKKKRRSPQKETRFRPHANVSIAIFSVIALIGMVIFGLAFSIPVLYIIGFTILGIIILTGLILLIILLTWRS